MEPLVDLSTNGINGLDANILGSVLGNRRIPFQRFRQKCTNLLLKSQDQIRNRAKRVIFVLLEDADSPSQCLDSGPMLRGSVDPTSHPKDCLPAVVELLGCLLHGEHQVRNVIDRAMLNRRRWLDGSLDCVEHARKFVSSESSLFRQLILDVRKEDQS